MSDRLPPELEGEFPNLFASGYQKTSDPDLRYNCVAWAAGWDTKNWWEPAREPGMYWPEEVPEGFYVETFVRLFKHLGYDPCESPDLEPGFEKIAIYGDKDHIFQHVARQLPAGDWTSKLGPEDDIRHQSLDAFVGSQYGDVMRVMKRKR